MDNHYEQRTVSGLSPARVEILELKERIRKLEQEVASLRDVEERVFERLRKAYREARASYSG